MAWEDCVVDVHSVKLSQHALESMFSKCGAVRSVIHWKGQGEKQHVFMEYRSPSAAESARTIGLDRNDLQVIKLSNNEMLKKKFRELEKSPGNHPRSNSSYSERSPGLKDDVKEYRLPAKPTPISAYSEERDTDGRYRTFDSDRSRTRHGPSWHSSSTSFPTSSVPGSRPSGRLSPRPANRRFSLALDKDSAPFQSYSKVTHDPIEREPSVPHYARDPVPNLSRAHADPRVNETLPIVEKSSTFGPPGGMLGGPKTTPDKSEISSTVIEIPHAGEVIRFDLEKQLEHNPAGIIRMLSTVKADQKLWMMIAAHYNGKHNLEAARDVLEAAIDMAVQAGVETDTKPFWHLLSQINVNLKAGTSTRSSVFSPSPTASTFTSIGGNSNQAIITGDLCAEAIDQPVNLSLPKEETRLPEDLTRVPSQETSTLTGVEVDTKGPLAGSRRLSTSIPQLPWPTGPRNRDLNGNTTPLPAPSVPPSGPVAASARLQSLQNEIGTLREKQTAVLEDLSFVRAAKRRAEDEIKEERSIRRKLEKHLRAAEDALARSKRMEDAALDQVKREVEARRKAEELLAAAKAERDRAGGSLFAHPSANDAAMLLQLASMIRGVSSNDPATPWQFRVGGGNGVASSTAGSQPDT